MGRLTSSERRGAIVLIAIIAVIIAAMALYSGFGTPVYHDPLPPASQPAGTEISDTADASRRLKTRGHGRRHAKADSATRRKKQSSRQSSSYTGRQRDFLDESVESSRD